MDNDSEPFTATQLQKDVEAYWAAQRAADLNWPSRAEIQARLEAALKGVKWSVNG